jgi:hypothetical protein
VPLSKAKGMVIKMKKRKRLAFISLVLLLSFLFQGGLIIAPSASSVMPEEFMHDNEKASLSDINKNHSLQVFTLGEINIPQGLKEVLLVTPINNLDLGSIEPKVEKRIKTLFIGQDISDRYLNDLEFKKLDKLLDKGFSVYLFGNKEIDQINKFYDLTSNTSSKAHIDNLLPLATNKIKLKDSNIPFPSSDNSNFVLGYFWVSKNRCGEYITGKSFFDGMYIQGDITKKAIVSAWHRQKDREIDYVVEPSIVQKDLTAKLVSTAHAADWTTGSLGLGPGWRVWGWHKTDWSCEYGYLTEWQSWADLWQNGQPYLAYAAYDYLDPIQENEIQNWGIWYGGDVDYYVGYQKRSGV